MPPQRPQHHISLFSLKSCMFTLLPSINLLSNPPAAKIITQPGRFAVSGRGNMRRSKQTGSCLHGASAELSIFNSVRNSWRACGGGRNVWLRTRHVRSTLKFADGPIFLQNSLQNEELVDGEMVKKTASLHVPADERCLQGREGGTLEFLAAFTARQCREISLPSDFSWNPLNTLNRCKNCSGIQVVWFLCCKCETDSRKAVALFMAF